VAEDLDRGVWHVSIILSGASLPQIPEHPELILPGFYFLLRLDSSQLAQELELRIRPRATTIEHGLIE
jgi:hypothetical protein